MEQIKKIIHSQDAGLKGSARKSGETSLNLSNEILEFLCSTPMNKGEEHNVTFTLHREDLLKALVYIFNNLPLYTSSSKSYAQVDFDSDAFAKYYTPIEEFFGTEETKYYTVNLLYRPDGRIYLNGLRVGSFSLRNYLIEDRSALYFQKDDLHNFTIRLVTGDFEEDIDFEEDLEKQNEDLKLARQVIYYGAPGTGKSHKIKEYLEEKNVPKANIFRTTFHPDSDYSTFVGAYKPTKGKRNLYGLSGSETICFFDKKTNSPIEEDIITYKFVPQAFLQAYTRAYQTEDNVYLVIEEINRGNCAQIFGDLFQLLDRDENGNSEYTINADTDLGAYLIDKLCKEKLSELGLLKQSDGEEPMVELSLPSNLYIFATMNTSDQSLFPIDSAFKRRWDWEYEPIKYKNTDWKIDVDGTMYSWVKFQEEVNARILKDSGSEDKMMGDYFVNPHTGIISKKLFLNKVLFYLWNDVCKDGDADIFPTDNDFSFSKLYDSDNTQVIKDMMARLGVEPLEGSQQDEEDEGYELDENNENSKKRPKYTIDGGSEQYSTPVTVQKVIENYARQNDDTSVDDMIKLWNEISERNNCLVSEWKPSPNDNQPFANKRRVEIKWGDNKSVWVLTGWTEGIFQTFIRNVKDRLGIVIEKV